MGDAICQKILKKKASSKLAFRKPRSTRKWVKVLCLELAIGDKGAWHMFKAANSLIRFQNGVNCLTREL